MAAEEQRTRLIAEIAGLLSEGSMPADARAAGLTLIGWLARRMPGECASQAGVKEMSLRTSAARPARAEGPASAGSRRQGVGGRRSR